MTSFANRTNRRFVLPVASALASVGLVAFPCLAESTVTTDWLEQVSGAFNDPSNWSAGVPGPKDFARFLGAEPSTAYDVLFGGSVTVGGFEISAGSPRFLIGRGGRGSAVLVNADLVVQSNPLGLAALAIDGLDLSTNGSTTVAGATQTFGALTIADASLTTRGLQIGSLGNGTLNVQGDGQLLNADAAIEWGVGIGGTGVVNLTAGAFLDLDGGTLRLASKLPQITAASATLTASPGSTIALDGGTLFVGGTPVGQTSGGSATATIQGDLVGPGLVIVGHRAAGTLTFGPEATIINGEATSVRVGDGAGGSGKLVLESSLTLQNVAVGFNSPGTFFVQGASNATSIDHLSMGVSNNTSTLTMLDGASLAVDVLELGTGAASMSILSGSMVVSGLDLSSNSAATQSFTASGSATTLALPPIEVSGGRFVPLIVKDGAVATVAGAQSSEGGRVRVEVVNGGHVEVNGPLSLLGGSNQERLTMGPFGGTIHADSVVTHSTAKAEWVLSMPTGFAVPPLTASTVQLAGPINVTVGALFTPTEEQTIRLVEAGSFTMSPPSTILPTLLGFPAILQPDPTGLSIRIIDHIDGFVMPGSILAVSSEAFTVPTTILYDGAPYDVSSQAVWTFLPATIAERTGPSTFRGLYPGTGTATVSFGPESISIPIEVTPALPSPFEVASATVIAFGNDDSGWDGPGLFTYPYGLGPQSLSDDGQIIAFPSLASNLNGSTVAGTPDLFVHDFAANVITELTSTASNDTSASPPGLSGDGRFVATTIDGPTSGDEVAVVIDRTVGTPEIVSIATDGTVSTANTSERALVSDDGRFVAFVSSATNLVDGDTNGVGDVFVRDRTLGVTTRASVSPTGGQFVGASRLADMTPDGRYILFLRSFSGWKLAYRYDRLTGTSMAASPGQLDDTPSIVVEDARITSDGQKVVFLAVASEPLLAGPTPIGAQAYQRDLAANVTTAVSVSEVGAWANAGIEAIAISGDARYVAMTSKASNLVPGAPGEAEGLTGLLRRDQVANRNEFLSTGIAGGEGSGTEAFDDDVYPFLAMTPDGSRIAFGSKASNIVPLDFAGHNDVFVLDTSLLLFGDLDGDGVVGARDIAILLGAWGSGGAADLDGNGSVGAEDLALLLGAWGG